MIETKSDLQVAILHQLGQGEIHAIHKEPLAKILGVNDRIVRDTIVEMRHNGIPIIGSLKGYYLANNTKEIKAAREFLLGYVKSMCVDIADYKRLIKQFDGQIKMRL